MKELLLLVALAACGGGNSDDRRWASIDQVTYAVPDGWSGYDRSTPDRRVLVWAPEENAKKESITLVRSRPLAALVQAGPEKLREKLEAALAGLPHAKFSTPHPVKTSRGFTGLQVEGEFVPPGASAPVRRIHLVLVDGTSFLHIFYTATDIADTTALRGVLDSLHGKA